MAQRAREPKLSRRRWLLAGLGISLSRAAAIETLSVTCDGDMLHVSLPRLRFLTGRPLERLKDGASVVFLSQLTLFTDRYQTPFRRAPERFVVSYDLWEEKFSVTTLGSGGRSGSRLTAESAEAWCLESLAISASGLAADRPFWLRFELRAADPKEELAVVGEPGISLTRLIELFSRRPRPQQPNWTADAGPMRLVDLRRAELRKSRIG